jgi:plasmid replication initiation protein
LVSKILNPNIYARLNLSLINSFSSKYALNLYELFCDYKSICQTPNIQIEDFKKLMGVEHKYDEFKTLSNRVIKPALCEVNKLVNCEAIAKYEKNGKSVYALKFYFKDFETKVKNDSKNEISRIGNSEQKNLYEKLMSIYKLSHFQAKEVVRSYPIAYINETLEIAKIKKNQNVVKNI